MSYISAIDHHSACVTALSLRPDPLKWYFSSGFIKQSSGNTSEKKNPVYDQEAPKGLWSDASHVSYRWHWRWKTSKVALAAEEFCVVFILQRSHLYSLNPKIHSRQPYTVSYLIPTTVTLTSPAAHALPRNTRTPHSLTHVLIQTHTHTPFFLSPSWLDYSERAGDSLWACSRSGWYLSFPLQPSLSSRESKEIIYLKRWPHQRKQPLKNHGNNFVNTDHLSLKDQRLFTLPTWRTFSTSKYSPC